MNDDDDDDDDDDEDMDSYMKVSSSIIYTTLFPSDTL